MTVEIYKATNKTNKKSYIGLTEISMWDRHCAHYDETYRGSDTYFHRALRKYNISVWDWKVLAECETREEAGEIEKQMIIEHNTFGKNGYNSTTGGESGWTVTEEIRKKMSRNGTGKVFTDEHRANLSKSLKGRAVWNKGKKHSKEHIENLSKSLKGRAVWNKGKPGCFSEKTINQMSKTRKGRPAWNKGKSHTEEHKANMSAARKGIPWSKARRDAHEAKKNAYLDV